MGELLVKGALVHRGLGDEPQVLDVRIRDGKFAEIGASLAAEESCQVVDGRGLQLFPGFVNPMGCWGGIGPGMDEYNLLESSAPVTPQLTAVDVFQVDSVNASRLYHWGITATCLTPDFGNLFGGYGAVYKTFGRRPKDMLVKERAIACASLSDAVKRVHAGPGGLNTPMAMLQSFLKALQEGRSALASAKFASSQEKALADLVSGQIPLLICVDSPNMASLVAEELQGFSDLRWGLTGKGCLGGSAARFAILPGMADAALEISDMLDCAAAGNAAKRGAKIALSASFEAPEMEHAEALLWNANHCIRSGVDGESVLAMISSIPAEILGVSARIGSIQPGLDADFSLWRGNPIERFDARMEGIFIEGRELPKEEKVRICW